MLEFQSITPALREQIHPVLYAADGHGSEYSFANLFFWGEQKVAFLEGKPVFLSRFGKWTSYQVPQGCSLKEAVTLLREDAKERKLPFRLFGVTPKEVQELSCLFPREFAFRSARDSFDYVYDIQRLAELAGKKLQAKRNHCNRFEAAYPNYEVLPLTQELLPLCRDFAEKWFTAHAQNHLHTNFDGEKIALSKAFDHFGELKMEGILLRTEDGVMGFSMGNRIREDTFDVNFEKALAEVNGAYPMVNREFARSIREKYPEVRFLNREDDMGIAGLRQAKESYFPDILLEKFIGEEIR